MSTGGRKRARKDSKSQSESASPSEERKPAESTSASNTSVVSRAGDADFWFEDGSVVIVAGDVEFRVYKGLLAKHSPVFKDTFAFRQSALSSSGITISEGGTGCPLVRVQDAPGDFKELLRVCMPEGGVNPFLADSPSYQTVSAIIRLGHKYQIATLVKHAVQYLKNYFTSDFEVWTEADSHLPPKFERVHCIGVVNLARLAGELSILPTALLLCGGLDADITKVIQPADGLREQLTPADIGRCFAARVALMRESFGMALRIFCPQASEACKNQTKCQQALQGMLKDLEGKSDMLALSDVFQPFIDVFDTLPVCVACQEMVEERDWDERRALWKRLPTIMGLTIEGWDSDEESDHDGASGNEEVAS